MIARWLIPFPLVCAWPFLSAAQELRFQHITTDDGLSDNAITCVFEDRAGYIWIGTEHGLNRYDGQLVQRIDSAAEQITAITQDKSGTIWFSTIGAGLGRLDPHTGNLQHMRHDPHDPRSPPDSDLNHVLAVDDDLLVLSTRSEGAVWFDTRKGPLRARGFRKVVLDQHGDTLTRAHQTWCHSALRIDEQRLWFSVVHTRNSYIVDARTGDLMRTVLACDPGSKFIVTNGAIVGPYLFSGGWAPGMQRFSLLEEQRSECIRIQDEVTAIVPWGDGQLLAGTKLHGILRMTTEGHTVGRYGHDRGDASSLGNDRVRCMLKDRAGNLWVGTAEGLSVHAPRIWRFNAIPLLGGDGTGDLVFHRLQQDADGTIRIATSAGFFLVQPQTLTVRRVALRIRSKLLEPTGLFDVAPGVHFIGTETGMLRYDPLNERPLSPSPDEWFEQYYTDGMFQVRGIHLDTMPAGPRMVVAALGFGPLLIKQSGIRGQEDLPGYPTTGPSALLVRDVERDAHGAYWQATAHCLMRWFPPRPGMPSRSTRWSSEPGAEHALPGHDLTDVFLRRDTTWISMRDAGLARVVNDSAEGFMPPAHIPHDALGVTLDNDGYAWSTTSNGLVRLDPQRRQWLHVPVNDGRAFKRASGCILTLADGRIAFCAYDHLLLFDPSAFLALPDLPEPMLERVSDTWGELPVDEHASIEVTYRASAFDATITALRPVGPGQLRFLYRLEGIDAAPRVMTAQEALRYAGVPTGTHRLLVRVRDEFGREGPEGVLLTVSVTGPFWQRWWFFMLVLGTGALGMYLFSRFRQKQRMKLQRVRDRIARDLHDDIGSTLGSISFYSEALKRKLGDSDDAMAQQVAARIGSSSREMIDQMSDIVWSVDPKNDDAGALSTRLQAFAGDLLATKNITLRFHADAELSERKLSAEQRRNLFLICKEVLHNTVKYADARSVTITLKSSARALELLLADDGKGFDPANMDSYNGNGLPNMRARAEAIGAVFAIESSPGTGTRVSITVPQHMLTPRSGD